MLNRIKDITFFIVLGAGLLFLNKLLGSDFIITFLKKDLITILIALFAINTTTFGLILTGITNIIGSQKCNFEPTIKELKLSITEQVIYIIIAVIVMSIIEGGWYKLSPNYIKYMLEICLTSVLVAALSNLHDTATAVFIILEHENGSNK